MASHYVYVGLTAYRRFPKLVKGKAAVKAAKRARIHKREALKAALKKVA